LIEFFLVIYFEGIGDIIGYHYFVQYSYCYVLEKIFKIKIRLNK